MQAALERTYLAWARTSQPVAICVVGCSALLLRSLDLPLGLLAVSVLATVKNGIADRMKSGPLICARVRERTQEAAVQRFTVQHRSPLSAMTKKSDNASNKLREFGLTYPGAHLKSPWPNHKDLAVNDKTFAYLSVPGKLFSISCKLKESATSALKLSYTTPTHYGLGKWGWVTATIEKGEIPMDLFRDWIDESYRSQAPKKLVRELDAMLE